MYVNSWNGQVDVGNRIGSNLTAGTLLVPSGRLGASVQASMTNVKQGEPPPPGDNPSMYISSASAVAGQWFKVPDDSVIGRLGTLHTSLDHYDWTTPAGTFSLDRNFVRATDSILNVLRYDNLTYSGVSVMLNSVTYDGLVSLGLVSRDSPKPSGNFGGSAGDDGGVNWNLLVTTVLVLGVLGAAIYFLPKSSLKGLG